MPMRYTLVGHPCQDKQPAGFQWGGGVVYSGLMAAQLDADVHIFTRCQAQPALDERLHWHLQPGPHTTVFENRYDPQTGMRKQIMHQRAGDISLEPLEHLKTPPDILHLAPVANEVDLTHIPTLAAHSWLVATPQGWMRRTDENGVVFHVPWENAPRLLPHLHALALSDEDVNGDLALVRHYAETIPYVLYTVGLHGAVLFQAGQQVHIDAEPAQVVDPTGAGDVIAAAFFVRLRQTGDPIEAVRFGTIAAALAIEAEGTSGIPNRQQIEARRTKTKPR